MIEWSDWLRAELTTRALQEAPHEACGLITEAPPTEEGIRGRLALWAAENAAGDPTTSFLIAPASQLGIITQITKRGERLLGVYHSHPNQGAAPSDRDRELARLWPGLTWLIVGLHGVVEPGDADEPDFFSGILVPE